MPGENLSRYVLSNGTAIVSNTQVVYYTPAEILKIEVAGGALVIAVLVLTYTIYSWYMAKYRRWQQQKALEERVNAGEEIDPNEYPPIPKGINRTLLWVVGFLIIFAGIAMVLLPS